ncbi:MAG TPA: Na+/H+ antiporter NhaA [Roseiflexaceae bacterium]|nr:Na+/H+ antiporter NhaA [Roseiflexaceae bacterium]
MEQKTKTLARDWRDTPLVHVLRPMQRFIHNETASGIVLMAATVAALVLANSPLAQPYDALLHTKIGITVGPFALSETLAHWINDGLMALFFFLVGMELKREALAGELANPRQALLPILAAIGGAALPAVIYTLINWGGPGAPGWGVPMATDIAFALGVLALLGSRVPWALKVFLTAVAVIDDLLAVLVIALFYSDGLNLGALGIGLGVLVLLAVVNMLGIRLLLVYVTLGLVVWLAFLQSGVHATLAGVLVALTIPARSRIDHESFLSRAYGLLEQFRHSDATESPLLTDERQEQAVLELEDACESVQAPLQKLEHQLQPWVAFGVMPVFALANAGVALSAEGLAGEGLPVVLGIAAGLVLGKPVGLFAATWLAVRLGVAQLPQGVTWQHIAGAGCLAGLGFTMSLFIATLGFEGAPELLAAAKLGILVASLVAGLLGYAALRLAAPAPEPQQAPAASG